MVSIGALQVNTENVQMKPPESCVQFEILIATNVDVQTLSTINDKQGASIALASYHNSCQFKDQIISIHAVKKMHASVENGRRHVARPLQY